MADLLEFEEPIAVLLKEIEALSMPEQDLIGSWIAKIV